MSKRAKNRSLEKLIRYFKNSLEPPEILRLEGISYWQVRIFYTLLGLGVFFGIFVLIPALFMAVKAQYWGLVVFDISAYLLAFYIWRAHNVSFELRVKFILLIIFSIGVWVIMSVGILSGGPAWLFTFAVLSGVFLGVRFAIAALLLNGLTLFTMGYLTYFGHLEISNLTSLSLGKGVVAGINFIFLNAVAAISMAGLMKGLKITSEKEKNAIEIIKQEREELINAKKHLEDEFKIRIEAEESFQNSEKRYRLIAENVADVIWTMDMNLNFTYISPSVYQQRGYTVEEAMEHSMDQLVMSDSLEGTINLFTEKLSLIESGDKEGLEPVIFEVRQPCKDGSVIWTSNNARILQGHDRRAAGVLGITRDITERMQTEQELKQLNQFRESIIDNANIWLNVLDEKGDVVVWNKAAESISGYTKEEVVGHNRIWKWSYPDRGYRSEVMTKGAAIIEKNEVLEDFETTICRKDGKERDISWHSRNLTDEGGEIIGSIALGRDITEQKHTKVALKKSEEKLARSKKMESLGLLAGGVAHDLNNVLSGIVSYPELILMDLSEDSKLRKPIETIQESGHRAAAIVQDLLTVARGVAVIKETLNLNDIISDYLNSPEFSKLKQFNSSVSIKDNLSSDLLNIDGSTVHIRKVIMNLVSNASEAVEGDGNVIISTENRYVDEPLRGYDDVEIGEYAILSVSDDGTGINSDDLERIFEPFYTKKALGRSGTGLGLAVVWNTVQDHNGYINVTTEENSTIFELYFPITRNEMPDKDLSIPIGDYKGNGETILVIDDVDNQREISCKMLDTLGYTTKAVSSGEEAVEYLKENTIDLLLLDMIMTPGINGRKTYERIVKIHPRQRAIIVSGFTETDEVQKAQELGAGKYLKKPLTLKILGLAVREELAN